MRKLLFSPALKHLYLFLFLSLVITGGWKILNLDDKIYVYFSSVTTILMNSEIKVSFFLIDLFVRPKATLDKDVITFSNNSSIQLMAGCSGLKQIIQWVLIMLIYPGPWKYKSWFIPVSAFILYLSAIFHFTLLAFILYKHPAFFTFFHQDLSRWLFFGTFFLLWVFWEEKIIKKNIKIPD